MMQTNISARPLRALLPSPALGVRLMTALQVLQGSPQADRIKQEKDEKSNAPTLGLMIALAGGVSNTSDDQGCTSCACLVFISSE